MKKMVSPLLLALVVLLAACTPSLSLPDAGTVTSTMNTALAATFDAKLEATAISTPAPSEPPAEIPTPELTNTPEPSEIPAAVEAAAGLKLAYSDSQGDLWFWKNGSVALRLTDSADVADFALSPDGSRIFYARSLDYSNYSLWLIDTNGENEHQVMSAADFAALPRPDQAAGTAPTQLGWVPGSNTAVFTTYHFFDGPGVDFGNDLRLVNGSTGAVSTLLEPGQGGGRYSYSPDGSQIALVSPNQIDLINSDGSNRRKAVLTYADVLTYTESPFLAQPLWAPDGSLLRVIIPAADRMGKPADPGSVWEISTAGGKATRLLEFSENGLGPGAALSPDLQWLAYFKNSQTGGQSDLHIASLDGSKDEVYASGSLNWVTWTNDSKRFVWTKYGEVGSNRQIYLGALGAEPLLLGAPQVPQMLSWVKGDQYLFFENDGGNPPAWKLYLGQVGASNRLLADLAAGDRIPQFVFTK